MTEKIFTCHQCGKQKQGHQGWLLCWFPDQQQHLVCQEDQQQAKFEGNILVGLMTREEYLTSLQSLSLEDLAARISRYQNEEWTEEREWHALNLCHMERSRREKAYIEWAKTLSAEDLEQEYLGERSGDYAFAPINKVHILYNEKKSRASYYEAIYFAPGRYVYRQGSDMVYCFRCPEEGEIGNFLHFGGWIIREKITHRYVTTERDEGQVSYTLGIYERQHQQIRQEAENREQIRLQGMGD